MRRPSRYRCPTRTQIQGEGYDAFNHRRKLIPTGHPDKIKDCGRYQEVTRQTTGPLFYRSIPHPNRIANISTLMMPPSYLLTLWALLGLRSVDTTVIDEAADENKSTSYGVDVSFPIHHPVSTNYIDLAHNIDPSVPVPPRHKSQPLQPLGNRHATYIKYLNDCRRTVAGTASIGDCDLFEYDRMLMNRRQPQSMVNYTETGFQKVKAPEHLNELVTEFWQKNRHSQTDENWGRGNSYLNYWDNPTRVVSVDDSGLRGSGARLKEEIWAALSAVMEEWTQQELQPSSLYGIRVYSEGAIMLPHVDRLPLVASAILNVAQDVDEDWPTEIYDHQGRAHNITIHPGEMLLFESASCIHGHPFPLKGRYYASIFIHFEPTGRPLGMSDDGIYYLKGEHGNSHRSKTRDKERYAAMEYRQNTQKGHGGQSSSYDGKLPPYIQRESPEEAHWLREHPTGWTPPYDLLPPDAHVAAQKGQLADLQLQLEEKGPEILTQRDENGWQVLHQGVAGGNTQVVEFLLSKGAEINARTHGGYGETPLRIAEKRFGSDSSLVKYLKNMGGLSIGPEL